MKIILIFTNDAYFLRNYEKEENLFVTNGSRV